MSFYVKITTNEGEVVAVDSKVVFLVVRSFCPMNMKRGFDFYFS